MKVRHLGKSFDHGGAAKAAHCLHRAMLSLGHESECISVSGHSKGEPEERGVESKAGPLNGWAAVDRQMRKETATEDVFELFSGLAPDDPEIRLSQLKGEGVDAVVLHWLPTSFDWIQFFDCSDIPVLWRLPDLFPLTGGCHYPGDCLNYREASGCRECPYGVSDELVRMAFWLKRNALNNFRGTGQMTFVAQSEWIKECIEESQVAGGYPVEVIRNGVDRGRFFPMGRHEARKALGMDEGKFVTIACGGLRNRRKGVRRLVETLAKRDLPESLELVVLGDAPEDPSFHSSFIRFVKDVPQESMRLYFAAADILAFPSLQDNCPNVVLEAHACELPALCFDNSGVRELITEGKDGTLVPSGDFESFSDTLLEMVENGMSFSGGFSVDSDADCASQYLELIRTREAGNGQPLSDAVECGEIPDLLEALASRMATSEEEIRKLNREMRHLERRKKIWKQRCEGMEQSTSWKLTAPLRKIRDRVRLKGREEK